MAFPVHRLRRTRWSEGLRRLVRETALTPDHFIYPMFVRPGRGERRPISSMPGCFQYSVDTLVKEAKEVQRLGIPAVILFGIPEKKDEQGSGAWISSGVIQKAARALKDGLPDLTVITDLCFCEYTSHGHCGVVRKNARTWHLDNDATLANIAKTAVSQAKAGADVIAPSGMIDGMVKQIRRALDKNGFPYVSILSYSAKYASAFYGPFREAADSPPRFGDRTSYQMDPANAEEAMREIAADLQEGADVVMVKPALAYLDIVREVKRRFGVPLAAYNVSGEYAMIKAAAKMGWIDEKKAMMEALISIRRAGADMILTYFAKEAAKTLG